MPEVKFCLKNEKNGKNGKITKITRIFFWSGAIRPIIYLLNLQYFYWHCWAIVLLWTIVGLLENVEICCWNCLFHYCLFIVYCVDMVLKYFWFVFFLKLHFPFFCCTSAGLLFAIPLLSIRGGSCGVFPARSRNCDSF